jgi:hypothetical protein
MKFIVALGCALLSTAAMAGELECRDSQYNLTVALSDHSDNLVVTKNGATKTYQLTRESQNASRYQLPYVVYSETKPGLRFSVYRDSDRSSGLLARLTFVPTPNDPQPTYIMDCSYLATE